MKVNRKRVFGKFGIMQSELTSLAYSSFAMECTSKCDEGLLDLARFFAPLNLVFKFFLFSESSCL